MHIPIYNTRKDEAHLDMILRADPGASDGIITCRVYSPEINTQDKLRKVFARQLGEEDSAEIPLSASTLQRMLNEYLKARKCRISFSQSDHNTYPTCETLRYAVLQFSFDVKSLAAKRDRLSQLPRPLTRTNRECLDTAMSK